MVPDSTLPLAPPNFTCISTPNELMLLVSFVSSPRFCWTSHFRPLMSSRITTDQTIRRRDNEIFILLLFSLNTSPPGALQRSKASGSLWGRPPEPAKRFCRFCADFASFASFASLVFHFLARAETAKTMWRRGRGRRGKFEYLNWPIRATKVNQDSLWNLPTDQSWLSKFRLDFAKNRVEKGSTGWFWATLA